ncbi:MAG: tRNA pseudouridine(55) synthase TruB, partial [Actinomycetota bacterium]|nr:tRNA pseudouridine(55) synthase TruB [Actinomycetota bacterium]
SFPSYRLTAEEATAVGFGQALRDTDLGSDGPVALFGADGRFRALYRQCGRDARPVAVFT